MEPPGILLSRNTGPNPGRRTGTRRELDSSLRPDRFRDIRGHPRNGIRGPDFGLDLLLQAGMLVDPFLDLGHLPFDLTGHVLLFEHGPQSE